MNKGKKKKWTTKNTHIKRENRSIDIKPEKWYIKWGEWIIIALAILIIILCALNSHIVGYDRFVGMPTEWMRSLFD
ncbi:hypothetical protein [Bacteroides sp.]